MRVFWRQLEQHERGHAKYYKYDKTDDNIYELDNNKEYMLMFPVEESAIPDVGISICAIFEISENSNSAKEIGYYYMKIMEGEENGENN